MALLEIKKTPDGRVLARRKDGLPLTPEDRAEARRLAEKEAQPPSPLDGETQDDPVLSVDEWLPAFQDFTRQALAETPDLDWGWLRQARPELWRGIKAIEGTVDALGHARLSQVMAHLREWRTLMLKAEREWRRPRMKDAPTSGNRPPS